ncbi:hypothetical protein [Bacillus kwashiorkori]|uniref:hypothetical protein n=1 Tax=Bacillus kwashiorkori TaxID=1522318 RepID=UPI000784BD68|nr:hypothetical protein [Bacillus kwashiorkori]
MEETEKKCRLGVDGDGIVLKEGLDLFQIQIEITPGLSPFLHKKTEGLTGKTPENPSDWEH